MTKTTIPDFLTHLPVHKGYPVPFFAALVDGVPDFRFLDHNKQMMCLAQGLCAICGKPRETLLEGWVISGPMGLTNMVSTDPPMHEQCARYSLKVCPHLAIEKADRRETKLPDGIFSSAGMIKEKPSHLYLVRMRVHTYLKNQHVFLYRPFNWEVYAYENGVLKLNGINEQPVQKIQEESKGKG